MPKYLLAGLELLQAARQDSRDQLLSKIQAEVSREIEVRTAQQLRQLSNVGGDAPGFVPAELGPRQRLPAHSEKMLA
jgi:hypothetical protein